MTDQPIPPVAYVPSKDCLTQYDDEYSFNNHRGWWLLMAEDDSVNPPIRELPADAVRLVPEQEPKTDKPLYVISVSIPMQADDAVKDSLIDAVAGAARAWEAEHHPWPVRDEWTPRISTAPEADMRPLPTREQLYDAIYHGVHRANYAMPNTELTADTADSIVTRVLDLLTGGTDHDD